MNTTSLLFLSIAALFILIIAHVYAIRRILKSRSDENLKEDLVSKQTQLENFERENRELKESTQILTDKNQDLVVENTRLSTELQSLQKSIEKDKGQVDEVKSALINNFKSMATEALQNQSKQFLTLASEKLQTDKTEIKGELEKRSQFIEKIIEPLDLALKEYSKKVDNIERDRHKTGSLLENEIKRLAESNSALFKETSALKDALKKPHVRGRWGEVQLKNCIEMAGMSEYADVDFQSYHEMEEGKNLIPDMIVRMPGGKVVVVDAKTPVEAFLSSLDSEEETQRNIELARHGRHVKDHIKKLSTKAYGGKIENSADFVIMFLPNESFLYAALEAESDIVEFAMQRKVLVATPPTFIGLLKVIRFGWNEEKVAENAKVISEVGKELHKRVVDFMEAYVSIGKSLDKAKEEFERGNMRLSSRVLTQAKRLEKLGAKSNKSLPEVNLLNDSESSGSVKITEPEAHSPQK